ncbi:MAG: rRNA large subunit methyltransferase I, partial [Bacteroidota bacterium]
MAEVILNKGKGNRNREGHPWVYDNEVAETKGNPKPGDIVSVIDAGKNLIGKGYYNPQSKLRVRLLTMMDEKIDAAFFHQKIKSCIDYRKKLGYTENYRVVFGEGDFIPGLVLDKFGDVIVLQTLALGMEKWKNEIVAAVTDLLKPIGVYERNDIPVRKLEGLE